MRATNPATRATLAFFELTDGARDVFFAGLFLLHKRHPTNPLVPREGSEVFPGSERAVIGLERFQEIWRDAMRRTSGNDILYHTFDIVVSGGVVTTGLGI